MKLRCEFEQIDHLQPNLPQSELSPTAASSLAHITGLYGKGFLTHMYRVNNLTKGEVVECFLICYSELRRGLLMARYSLCLAIREYPSTSTIAISLFP